MITCEKQWVEGGERKCVKKNPFSVDHCPSVALVAQSPSVGSTQLLIFTPCLFS